MVVGIAVNGWYLETYPCPDEINNPDTREQFANAVFDSVTPAPGEPCPMLWITDNAANNIITRSPFWQVIRGVVGRLDIADINNRHWPSYLAWSNLYKVSPSADGNPDGQLCGIQFDGCRDLLELELRNYRPKRLLLLTGLNWAKPRFFENICTLRLVHGSQVKAIGRFTRNDQTTKIVVAEHPRGRKGKRGQDGPWAQTIIRAFQHDC